MLIVLEMAAPVTDDFGFCHDKACILEPEALADLHISFSPNIVQSKIG